MYMMRETYKYVRFHEKRHFQPSSSTYKKLRRLLYKDYSPTFNDTVKLIIANTPVKYRQSAWFNARDFAASFQIILRNRETTKRVNIIINACSPYGKSNFHISVSFQRTETTPLGSIHLSNLNAGETIKSLSLSRYLKLLEWLEDE